jgi:hypothetical protein
MYIPDFPRPFQDGRGIVIRMGVGRKNRHLAIPQLPDADGPAIRPPQLAEREKIAVIENQKTPARFDGKPAVEQIPDLGADPAAHEDSPFRLVIYLMRYRIPASLTAEYITEDAARASAPRAALFFRRKYALAIISANRYIILQGTWLPISAESFIVEEERL